MNITVGQAVVAVETVSKEMSVQEFIRTKVNAGGREVSVFVFLVGIGWRT